ncbi:hypothetical protein [Massilia sp. TS11]|uniref:pilus assembly PilX family protein n=1 Tax=Massilia sp. TS11 TaxID=2908003 RepID=UPI001EDBE18C|nr:hypothetical protein [Massilia sp. TS11]MCG2583813.1 hypothetical protein [Massilia sp. TS11]
MNALSLRRMRGIALPVMMIILVVLLITGVYLLRSSNSATLAATNLAYESALSAAADLGIHRASEWLTSTATSNRALLDSNQAANGYVASYNTAQGINSSAFWDGAVSITDPAGNRIDYVIHRMCAFAGPYDSLGPPANTCVLTSANTSTMNNSIALGDSLASDAVQLAGVPRVHYVIAARISGPRGGNVINQAVVTIGG